MSSSLYPTAIDDFTTTHGPTDPKTGHASVHNKIGDALEKIETELGINPSGPYVSVLARLVAIEAAIGGGGGSGGGLYPNGVTDYGMVADNSTDNSPMLQNAINDIPQSYAGNSSMGGAIGVPAGRYVFNSPVDISDKYGITIICESITAFNEGDGPPFGTVFIANTPGMTLFDCTCSALIQHGPQFLGSPNFFSRRNNVTLVRLGDVNHWTFERPNFSNAISTTGVKALEIDWVAPASDNSYGALFQPRFSVYGATSICLNVLTSYGFNMFGGNFSTAGYGVKLYKCTETKFFGTKWNHAGRHVYCEGGSNEWHGCAFENFSDTEFAIEIARPAVGALPYSGRMNKFLGGLITGNTPVSATAKGVKITDLDPGTNWWESPNSNVFDLEFSNLGTNYVDGGQRNIWRGITARPANADTTGLSLPQLEAELNEIKAQLRTAGVISSF